MRAIPERLRAFFGGELWKVWGPMLFLVAVGFALAIRALEPPPPAQLVIATGGRHGAYHAFALRYREVLARQGYELRVLETAGSFENLRRLRAGEVDLALVQGGSGAEAGGGVEALASLFFEPLWLFYHGDEIARISDLAGRRLAIGAPESGTRALAHKILAANGVAPGDGLAELVEIGGMEAARALERGEVDGAIFVAAIDAEFIHRLLRDERLRLVSVRRLRAYQQRYSFLSGVVLGEGTVDLAKNLPPRDVDLLAASCSLVARADLHQALIPLLLKAMDEIHGPGGTFEPPRQFPSSRWVELPLNSAARAYLDHGPSFLHRFLPFRVALWLDRMKILLLPLLTLLLPVGKAAPPIYRWRMRSKIYRWYADLRDIEEVLYDEATSALCEEKLAALHRLAGEVSKHVSVPLPYMDELYHLQLHIELVRTRLSRQADEAQRELP